MSCWEDGNGELHLKLDGTALSDAKAWVKWSDFLSTLKLVMQALTFSITKVSVNGWFLTLVNENENETI